MEVLDTLNKKENKSTRYSKFSFFFALMASLLFVYFFIKLPSTINAEQSFFQPSLLYRLTMQISILLGAISTVLSIIRKEPGGILKWTGAFINILFIIGIVGMTLILNLK